MTTCRPVLYAFCTLAAVVLLVAGCDAKPADAKPADESVLKDSIAKMREFVRVLKTVKDEPSGTAAAPKLKQLRQELNALQNKQKELGTPAEDVRKQIVERHQKDVRAVMEELCAEMKRIQSDPQVAPYGPANYPRL